MAKAKALRGYIEPLLTKCKTDTMTNRRVVFSYLQDKEAIKELFGNISNKIATRPGGYTRVLHAGNRAGDNAEIAMIELVDYNDIYTKPTKGTEAPAKKTRRGKTKAATTVEGTATKTTKTKKVAPAAEVPLAEEVKDETTEESVEPKAEE